MHGPARLSTFQNTYEMATRPDETFICPEYSKRPFWTIENANNINMQKL